MWQAIQKDPLQLQIRTQGTNRRRWLSRKDVSFKDGALRPNTLFNQPVQGLAADGMKAALVVLQKCLEELDAELVAVIHDEVIVQTPPALADRVRGIVEQAMIDGMQAFVSSVPITSEKDPWRGGSGIPICVCALRVASKFVRSSSNS